MGRDGNHDPQSQWGEEPDSGNWLQIIIPRTRAAIPLAKHQPHPPNGRSWKAKKISLNPSITK